MARWKCGARLERVDSSPTEPSLCSHRSLAFLGVKSVPEDPIARRHKWMGAHLIKHGGHQFAAQFPLQQLLLFGNLRCEVPSTGPTLGELVRPLVQRGSKGCDYRHKSSGPGYNYNWRTVHTRLPDNKRQSQSWYLPDEQTYKLKDTSPITNLNHKAGISQINTP